MMRRCEIGCAHWQQPVSPSSEMKSYIVRRCAQYISKMDSALERCSRLFHTYLIFVASCRTSPISTLLVKRAGSRLWPRTRTCQHKGKVTAQCTLRHQPHLGLGRQQHLAQVRRVPKSGRAENCAIRNANFVEETRRRWS